MYSKSLVESTFIEIINTKGKHMIIACIYKHPKQRTHDFNENNIPPSLPIKGSQLQIVNHF